MRLVKGPNRHKLFKRLSHVLFRPRACKTSPPSLSNHHDRGTFRGRGLRGSQVQPPFHANWRGRFSDEFSQPFRKFPLRFILYEKKCSLFDAKISAKGFRLVLSRAGNKGNCSKRKLINDFVLHEIKRGKRLGRLFFVILFCYFLCIIRQLFR